MTTTTTTPDVVRIDLPGTGVVRHALVLDLTVLPRLPLVDFYDRDGYSSRQACDYAGISYRELDYWARSGLAAPSVVPAAGSGSARCYSAADLAWLYVIKALRDLDLSLQRIRDHADELRDRITATIAAAAPVPPLSGRWVL